MKVYTSSMRCGDRDRLNITVKSGVQAFAPSWDMVMGYKKGMLSEKQYEKLYLERMRRSYVANRALWDGVLAKGRVVLCCYCKAGDFCHRVLLAKIFVKLGAKYGGEI